MKKIDTNLWMVKFRPNTIDELILQPEHKRIIEKYIQDGTFPHLILIGVKGTGKTSLATVLINTFDAESISLNASDERGIDTIREKIKQFVIVNSSKMKVVFLDEADKMTPDAFDALRNVMETYSSVCRFILTGNYDKFPEEIIDRCKVLRFTYASKKDIFLNVKNLLNKENVICSDDLLNIVIERHYPSFRHILNTLQENVIVEDEKQIIKEIIQTESEDYSTIIKKAFGLFCDNKIDEMRKYLIENSFQDYNLLYRYWMDNVVKPIYKVTVGEYAYRDTVVSDRELIFASMCYALHAGAYPFTLK